MQNDIFKKSSNDEIYEMKNEIAKTSNNKKLSKSPKNKFKFKTNLIGDDSYDK